jgi:Tol biopolymer transport system component/DNA-binding winged helix-turn-helix (wHTH) protein
VSKSEQLKRFYDFGPFRVDASERVLLREGQPVMLSPKLFDTLLALVERSGHIVEKAELMETVWPGTFVEESNLSSSVSLLRKTLGSTADGKSYIETVPRRGYRFAGAVEVMGESTDLIVGRRTRVHVVTHEEEETSTAVSETERPKSTHYLGNPARWKKRSVIVGLSTLVIALAGVSLGLRYFGTKSATKGFDPFSKLKMARLTTTGRANDAAISPDGKFVVHVVENAGEQSLWLRHIPTGSDQEIVPSNNDGFLGLTFSPDGNRIYFSRSGSLFEVPVLGGSAKKLLMNIDTAVTFSPDGRRMAFMRGVPSQRERLLIIANADGTQEQVLARHKLEDAFLIAPAWSPNGETIVFPVRSSSPDAPYGNLTEVRLKDGVEKQITSQQWSAMGSSCWLRDGTGLVVIAAEQESNSQLWFVSYPSGKVRRVTNDLNDYLNVSLNSDSSSLVTVQVERVSDIWIVPDGDNSRSSRITTSRVAGPGGVSWTPDGRIVHASFGSGYQEIWIMNKDGTQNRQLTFDSSRNSVPTVSRDGRYIVYVSYRMGTRNIWRMDIDGGNKKQLTHGSNDVSPQFSPDNQWVIYSSAEIKHPTLWKVPIDGGNAVQLTKYDSNLLAISPKDGQIAYAYDEPETLKRRVAIIPFTGGSPTKVFDFPSPFGQIIRWATDGRALTYIGNPLRANIFSQPLDGSPPKQITDFKSDRIFIYDWSRDGKNLAVARGSRTSDVVLITDQAAFK